MSCTQCVTGSVHEGTPRGKTIVLHGLNTYVTEPADGREVKAVIVLIPDAFGWEFVNNRLLADHYADKGDYRVYLPDFMKGHSMPVFMLDTMKVVLSPEASIFAKLYRVPGGIYGFLPWLILNRPSRSYSVVKQFMLAFRATSSVSSSSDASLPVGAAGFCWGGKHMALLAGDPDTAEGGKPLIDAGFTGHPSMLDFPGDVEKIRRPASFACPEKDHHISKELADKIAAIVEAKPEGQKGEMVWYPGVGHGFCVRADPTENGGIVAKQADAAEDQCIRWFDKHLLGKE